MLRRSKSHIHSLTKIDIINSGRDATGHDLILVVDTGSTHRLEIASLNRSYAT